MVIFTQIERCDSVDEPLPAIQDQCHRRWLACRSCTATVRVVQWWARAPWCQLFSNCLYGEEVRSAKYAL